MKRNTKRIFAGFLATLVLTGGSMALAGCGRTSSTTSSSVTSSSSATSSSNTTTSSSTSSTTTNAVASTVVQETKEEYISSCQTYDYDSIARNPDDYIGNRAVIYGKVVQVMEDGNDVFLRVSTLESEYGGWYDNIVMIGYERKTGDARILEDDMITAYGELLGLYTYTSTLGKEISIPFQHAYYLDIVG